MLHLYNVLIFMSYLFYILYFIHVAVAFILYFEKKFADCPDWCHLFVCFLFRLNGLCNRKKNSINFCRQALTIMTPCLGNSGTL